MKNDPKTPIITNEKKTQEDSHKARSLDFWGESKDKNQKSK